MTVSVFVICYTVMAKEKFGVIIMSENRPCSNEVDTYAISTEKVHSLYGEVLPDIVEERLKMELTHIKESGLSTVYSKYYLAAKHAHDNGQPTMALGDIGSSLVAFLLDITNVNPLPPHYICGNCNYTEFINDNSVYSCYDLPPKTCPVCGKALVYDGHNIPYEMLFICDDNRQPDIRLCYPMSFKENQPQGISNVNILGFVPPEMFLLLEKYTGVSYKDVNLNDSKIYELFADSRVIGIDSDEPATIGIPEFGTEFVRGIIKQAKPLNFGDLIRITGFTHSGKTWLKTANELLEDNICGFRDLPASSEDMYNHLINKGVDKNIALKILDAANKGIFKKNSLDKDPEIIQAFDKTDIPKWYINSLSEMRNMLSKSHAIEFIKSALTLAWYKVYYPIEFYAAVLNTQYADTNLEFLCKGKKGVEEYLCNLVNLRCSDNCIDSSDIDLFNECIDRGVLFKRKPDYIKKTPIYHIGNGEIFI